MITFSLSAPPSTNNLYRNVPGRGRVKTADYEAWIRTAGWEMKMQGAGKVTFLVGDLECRIRLSPASRIDIDNCKALPDLVQRMGVIKNDRQIRCMIIDARTELEKGRCEISLSRPVSDAR